MKYIISLIFICLLLTNLQAQYAVSNIPADLIKNADVVVRKDITEIEVQSINKSLMRATYVVTILNEKAKRYATKSVRYNKAFSKSVSIVGKLYDKNGKVIRKLKQKEVIDASAISDVSLYESSRQLIASLEHNQYPYTVEFSYVQPFKDQILPPVWSAQNNERQSVEEAILRIQMPDDIKLNYKNINIEEKPSISQNGTLYEWHKKNLKPMEREIFGPSVFKLLPMVLLTPSDFKWDKYEGSTRNWADYGKFFYDLNAGRDELPPELEAKVLEMCANISDPKEKIRILYEYMQQNTRYVSVQLGIGGWQTYDAAYVYKNGYGDCKALSNYMKSMLKRIGIESYMTFIYAGEGGLDFQFDFPNDLSNHAILCVPMEQDTVWLECTSSEKPIGYLGDFTDNRYGLLLTPEGGKLAKTPAMPAESNRQIRKATITLEQDGNARVEVDMTYTGYQQDNISYIALNLGTKDQEKWLRKNIDAGSFQLKTFAFEKAKSADIPTWYNNYELQATQWAGVSGSRIFLKPNVLERYVFVPPANPERKQQIELSSPYLNTDTITYIIPANYRVESMPDMPIQINEEFGSYEANIIQKDPRTLIYTRKIKMQKIVLPAEKYDAYRNFKRAVVKADKIQVVLSDKS